MNRRALRLAAMSFLLPIPVALAAPQAATLPSEQLVAMSKVPVRGVGDTVLPRVLPLESTAPKRQAKLAASLTRVAKTQRSTVSASEVAANGIPAAALRAYRTAEATMSVADPSCRLGWELLAGIGRIESDHGRYAGAVLGADGISTPEIRGLPLNGVGPVAAIADTDNGRMDGDTRWDRAVGPMQFIPTTWAMVGVDGDGDGARNPHDIDDAALAAAAYLCVGGHDLSTPTGAQPAVYSYNHSAEYVATVLAVAHAYATGKVDLPLLTATLSLPTGPGTSVELSGGRGVPIGASDEVSARGDGKPADGPDRAQRADERADDRRRNDPAEPADRDRGAPKSENERGDSRDRPNDDDSDVDESTGDRTGGTDRRGGDKADTPEESKSPTPKSPKKQPGKDPVENDAEEAAEEEAAKKAAEEEAAKKAAKKAAEEEAAKKAAEEEAAKKAAEEEAAPERAEGLLAICEDDDEALCLVGDSGTTIALPYAAADYELWIAEQTRVVVVYDLGDDAVTWENIKEPAKLD